jgi:hypothetical protein
MNVIEIPLKGLDNEPIKVQKKKPPRSINKDLVPLYFTACFCGAKNSGKTMGLVKLLKNFEEYPIYNSEGDKLDVRVILFCPTANSPANPIYTTVKDLDEEDIHLTYRDEDLLKVLDEIEAERKEIKEYSDYIAAYKRFLKVKVIHLADDELQILTKFNFIDPKYIPAPKYKNPRVIFMILDDMIGNNECFKRGNCAISNLTIKHRHLGINLIYTTQNPKSIPNIIRNNIDLWVLYRFANKNMVLDKLYEEVSSLVVEDDFSKLYDHATKEPYNALVVDTHPITKNENRFKRNFDTILSFNASSSNQTDMR